jgi:hypothetical protein
MCHLATLFSARISQQEGHQMDLEFYFQRESGFIAFRTHGTDQGCQIFLGTVFQSW